jgi:hypothetical protein
LKIARRIRLTLAGLILLAPEAVCMAQDPVANPNEVCSLPNLKDGVRVDGYIFRTYKSGDSDNCLQVLRDGKIIFRRTLDSLVGHTLGQPEDKESKVPAIPNGTDITGRGHPDMIVSWWTGGAHCCQMHYVFELEPKFKLLATIDARDSDPAYFADLDKNGHYYYIAEDWTFAYWWISFAGSPFHSVVLHYVENSQGGGFHLAIDKMLAPAPTPEEWQKALSDVRKELQLEQKNMVNFLPDVMWQKVIDLIYTGHSDLAWRFLEEVGPKAQAGNYPDLATFCSKLKTSPYWPDLAPTLKDTPPTCANAKPAYSR